MVPNHKWTMDAIAVGRATAEILSASTENRVADWLMAVSSFQ